MALTARRFVVLAAPVVVAFWTVLLLRPLSDFGMLVLSDSVQLLTAVVASAVMARTARRASGVVKAGWLCMAGVALSYGFGMVAWIFYEVWLRQPTPFPSLADAGFMTGIPLWFAGLLCLTPHPRGIAGWVRGGVDLLIATGLLLFVVWLLVVQPTVASGALEGTALIIAVTYPVTYAVLGGMALRSVADTGANRRAMTVLSLSLITGVCVNVLYLYFLSLGAYQSGHLIDSLFVVSLLLQAYASLQPDALLSPGGAGRAGVARRAAPLAPFVIAVPVGVLHKDDASLVVSAALALGAVSVRQSVAFLEQRQIATGISRAAVRQRLMATRMSDAMLMITTEGRIPFASQSLERFLGLSADQIVIEELRERIGEDDRLRLAALFAAVVRDGVAERARVDVLSATGWRQVEVDITRVDDDSELGEGAIVTFRDVSDQVEIERSLERAARADPLTGLPNRAVFMGRLEEVLQEEGDENEATVLVIDLDHFKTVNDSLGHRVGDTLLETAAHRLTAALPSCFVARLGGDEFGVLSRQASSIAAEDVAAIALQTFRDPLPIAGLDLVMHCSVGVARGRAGWHADDLLRAADTALYAAKSEGRDRYALFTELMGAAVRERLTLHSALPRALERGELELWYQPLVELSTGCVASFEALLRWRSPEHGLVPPARFVPLAEESGLIVDIGAWVLEEACHQLADWRAHHAAAADLSMAVNVSGRQFADGAVQAQVGAAVRAAAIPSRALTVEVTESLTLSAHAASALRSLRDLGVRIAMDDFGTGYSSLASLQRLPFDVLKLDRYFLNSLDEGPDRGKRFLTSIVSMAHSLDLRTVAEGVETDEHLRVLREVGFDKAQGYLFGRPTPAAEAEDLLRAGGRLAPLA